MACLSGCTTRTVAISSEPPGAEILVDDRIVGHAPLRVSVRGRWIYQFDKSRHTVLGRSPGMQSGLYRLEPTDVFIPGAVGCVVLVGCPWAAQIPDEVNVRLNPTTGP